MANVRGLALLAMTGLAACGGAVEEGGGGTTPVPGTNGLNYGQVGQMLSDAEEIAITSRGATVRNDSGGSQGDGTITLDAGFFGSGATGGSGTFGIFGEDVVISDGEGRLANGQTVRLFVNTTGTYAAAMGLATYGNSEAGPVTSPFDGETHFVTGFETNPSVFANLNSGSARYSGDFAIAGLVTDGGVRVGADGEELEGEIIINVSFGSTDRVNGSLNGSYDVGGGPIDVRLTLGSTAMSGNGFNNALGCTTCSSSTSRIDGTFYGPNANELGGVVTVDITTGGQRYLGAGTYIIDPS